jgi:hypothetical protein
MHNEKELHLVCSCYSHELHLERDSFFDEGDHLWYGSIWMRGYKVDSSWKWKLKQMWQILKHGTPYGDEVVLSKEHLEELLVYVQAQIKATENKA